jgi:hypothetical protein
VTVFGFGLLAHVESCIHTQGTRHTTQHTTVHASVNVVVDTSHRADSQRTTSTTFS